MASRRVRANVLPWADRILAPWVARTGHNGKTLKAGSTPSIVVGNILMRMAAGWVLVFTAARQTPKIGGWRLGRHIRPPALRYIHGVTGRLYPVNVPQGAMSTWAREWCSARKLIQQSSDGRWEITDKGRAAAAAFAQAQCHSPDVISHAPDGYRINGVDYPHPYLQPECPQSPTIAKGLWSRGWLAAWQGLPRENPDKRKRKAFFEGYDLAMKRKYGQ